MTVINILIGVILFFVIPIASAALARQLHFMFGLQGEELNISAILGKVGLWLLSNNNDSRLLNLFKDAVVCIFCLTHHIAFIETIVAYTVLYGPWGLLSIFIVPAVALIIQNYLQTNVYSKYYSEEESVDNTNPENNDRSN